MAVSGLEELRLTISELPAATTTTNTSPSVAAATTSSAAATTSSAAATTSSTTQTTSSASSTSPTPATSPTSSTSSSPSIILLSTSNLPAAASRSNSATPDSQASSTVLSASTGKASLIAATSSAAPTGIARSSPSSHSKTVAVAAGTVGAILGAIAALVMILLLLRWRKRHMKHIFSHDDRDPRSQGTDVDGVGTALQDEQNKSTCEAAPAYTAAHHDSLSCPRTELAGDDEHATRTQSDPFSASSPWSPSRPGSETSGLKPSPIGTRSELEVPAFHVPAELSPNPERSSINTPGRRLTRDGPVMHPNLDSTRGEAGGDGADSMGNKHVMSWTTYNGNESGPVR